MTNENSDQDRVFSLPNPGGSAPSLYDDASHHDQNEILFGSNPLVKTANNLLNLISQIKTLDRKSHV